MLGEREYGGCIGDSISAAIWKKHAWVSFSKIIKIADVFPNSTRHHAITHDNIHELKFNSK